MSRCSLRLDESLLDRSLPHGSASFSAGGGSWRSSRSLRPRRSQPQHFSTSFSEPLLLHQTPLKSAGPSLHNSVHSVASDSSLISSLLDESSIQESTLVHTLWGLDHDSDPKELNSTTIAADHRCQQQTLSRLYCKACEQGTSCSSSKGTSCSSSKGTAPAALATPREAAETSTIYSRDRGHRSSRTAPSGSRGAMSLRADPKELQAPGSLCDDCKEKQLPESDAITLSSCSSVASCLLGLAWSAALLTGRTAGRVFRWLCRRCHHTAAKLRLTRFPVGVVLLLVPLLLLLFSLCWFGPAGLQSVLPEVDVPEWRTAVSDVHDLTSSNSQSEQSREVQAYMEPTYSPTPPTESPTGEEEDPVDESGRLARLEQSLETLWDRVEDGGRRAEQRHKELLQLYADLLKNQHRSTAENGVETKVNILLDRQLSEIRTQLERDRQQREQTRQQDLLTQQSQTSRLDQLELQLQTLAARTQVTERLPEPMEVRRRGEAPPSVSSTLPAAFSVGVDHQSHDALLAEVARLEGALQDVRRDVEAVSECRDVCRQLATVQQTVSTRVQEEVRALVFGSQLTLRGGGGDAAAFPESLLQWLSQQFVSGADLQEALSSLERSILQNVSLQLQQRNGEESVREAVLDATEAAGAAMTAEDVRDMVTKALRLFAQDQTGLADYALESGGGSILSTRCSETYETKAALLSLFGVPLWYFSQSPRAVIQPDVHPGNCWAFRGSTGFLVIRLSMRILPTAFTLEHIPKALAPSGTLLSAPRDFSIYGLDDENQERGKLLGTYVYDADGEALQTYAITEENDEAFQIIEVKVLSNWGHQEYTCMYRFRVHGTPSAA